MFVFSSCSFFRPFVDLGGDSLFPLPLRSVAGEERMATANDDILHVLLGKMSIKQPTPGRPSNFQTEQVRRVGYVRTIVDMR